MKMHKELNELIMVSEVFPKALLAVLAAEPNVSVGDCAVASVLPGITTQTNNISRLYDEEGFQDNERVKNSEPLHKKSPENLKHVIR